MYPLSFQIYLLKVELPRIHLNHLDTPIMRSMINGALEILPVITFMLVKKVLILIYLEHWELYRIFQPGKKKKQAM